MGKSIKKDLGIEVDVVIFGGLSYILVFFKKETIGVKDYIEVF